MKLPVISRVVYNLTIPSTKQKVRFSPFIVKHQTALLTASHSEDINVMADTLKMVINECILDDINVDDLTIFDIEYIWIKITSKSVGETSTVHNECNHCKKVLKLKIPLEEVECVFHLEHNTLLKLSDTVGIKMKYPKYDDVKEDNSLYTNVIACMDYIYEGNDIISAKDCSVEELNTFLEQLSFKEFSIINQFFETIPKVYKDIEIICDGCKTNNTFRIEGLKSFFS